MKGLLTLDLALRLGFCKWNPGSRPTIGTYTLLSPCDRYGLGKYLAAYDKWLRKTITENDIEYVVYEENIIIHKGPKTTKLSTAQRLYVLTGTTESICFQMGVGYASVHVKTWRKHYLGNGNYPSDDAKEYAMVKARASGFNPQFNDAAEALGIMSYAANHFRIPTDWPDASIFGGRAG